MAGASFDSAASTPMLPEAVEAMLPYLIDHAANPSGVHGPGRRARRAVDEARDDLADVLGVEAGSIVFTSGGTEADNLAVLGGSSRRGGAVVCSAVEHPAVLEAARSLGGVEVGVDERGVIDLDGLAAVLERSAAEDSNGVGVVSVMAVNNEIGTIQPVAAVADLVRSLASDALLHTDAVQALPWIDVRPISGVVDALSISGHKFGGPKGVGALALAPGAAVAARQVGGGQERERRSGTLNVAGIVAMAVAARLTDERRRATVERVGKLRDRLVEGLVASIDGVTETAVLDGDRGHKIAGNAHLCIDGVEGEALLFLLDRSGISASTASACASGAAQPSHVLAALGIVRDDVAALRLSLGVEADDDEVDLALRVIPDAVARLRRTGS